MEMKRILNWFWWRRHGIRAVRVSHLTLDGVDIMVTTFKETGRHEPPASRRTARSSWSPCSRTDQVSLRAIWSTSYPSGSGSAC